MQHFMIFDNSLTFGIKSYVMLGGLNEKTTLELFTQNYLIWGRISFTIWKRIEFHVYPTGARLSRPLHLYTYELYFFCEITGLTRVRPGFWKTPLSSFEAPGLIYNYSAPGGWHRIPKSHRNTKSKKLWFISFNVQNHFSKTLIKYA